MAHQGRALHPRMVELIRKHRVLSPPKTYERWLEQRHHVGIGEHTVQKLREGHCLQPTHVERFLEYLSDATFHIPQDPRPGVLTGFRSTRSPQPLTIDDLVRAASVSCHLTKVREPATGDSFVSDLRHYAAALGRDGLRDLVRPSNAKLPPPPGSDWITATSEWLYIEHGRQHASAGKYPKEAEALAETHIGIARSRYEAQMRAWVGAEPWSLAFTQLNSKISAATIAIPVNEACYTRLVAGEMNTWEIARGDISTPSPFVVAEAVAMKPLRGARPARTRTREAMLSLICQIATISAMPSAGDDIPLRIFSADFTRDSHWRLTRSGFDVAAVLRGTQIRGRTRALSIDVGQFPTTAFMDSELFGLIRTLQRTFLS